MPRISPKQLQKAEATTSTTFEKASSSARVISVKSTKSESESVNRLGAVLEMLIV